MEPAPKTVTKPWKSALDVFSAELWCLIMDKIKNPEYLLDLASDPENPAIFRDLVKSQGTLWLSTVLPMVYPYLPKKDVLNLRLVSKDLRDSLDSFLEDNQPAEMYSNPRFCLDLRKYRKRNRTENETGFSQLVNEMRTLPGTKIVGGSVIAPAPGFQAFFEEFGGKLVNLDLRYEYTRWKFQIEVGGLKGDGVPKMDFLENVGRALKSCPNLKSFSIFSHRCEGVGDEAEVRRYLRDNPLPVMNKLTSLSFTAFGRRMGRRYKYDLGLDKYYLEILRRYAPQLEKLSMFNYSGIPLRVSMPRLVDLSLDVMELKVLRSLEGLGGPLTRIRLHLYCLVDIGQLFGLLEGYQQSLKEVSILFDEALEYELLGPFGTNWNVPVKLSLPEVTHFKLEGVQATCCTSFDFLVGMPKLENLELGLNGFERRMEEGEGGTGHGQDDKLEVAKYFKENGVLEEVTFYMSVIWQSLPKLRKVRSYCFGTRYVVHTREYYDYLHHRLTNFFNLLL